MKNWTLRMLVLAGVLVLLPLQTWAVCFNAGGSVLVIEVAGQVGSFFSLVGEDVSYCGPGTSMPLSGSAHIRSDGKAHFGTTTDGPVGSTCAPGWYQGTLDPPNFTTGAGFFRNAFGGTATFTFTPATCPILPQEPGSVAGTGNGTIQP